MRVMSGTKNPTKRFKRPIRIPAHLVPVLEAPLPVLSIGLHQLAGNSEYPAFDKKARVMKRVEMTAEEIAIIEELHRVHKKSRADIIGAALHWARLTKAIPRERRSTH